MKKLSRLPRFPQVITVDNYSETSKGLTIAYGCTYSDDSEDQGQTLVVKRSDLQAFFNRLGWDANTIYSISSNNQVVKIDRHQSFADFWKNATKKEKMNFIAGYMDSYRSKIVADITSNLLDGRRTNLASILNSFRNA